MRNHLALWGGIAAFFATLLGIGFIDIVNAGGRWELANGVIVGLITGGAVYAKQKLDDAREGRVKAGDIVVMETDEKVTFTLQLDGDPEELKDKKEVTFRVRRD